MKRDIDQPFYVLNPAAITALTSDAEARGEGETGEIGVMWVLKNRTIAAHWYLDADILAAGMSAYHAAALKNGIPKGKTNPVYQYSCFQDNTPDRKHALSIALSLDASIILLVETAQKVISGEIPDSTGGATYYYNPDMCTPSWANTFTETAVIGHHRFMRP